MGTQYYVNGKPASKEQYTAAMGEMATMMPPMTKEAQAAAANMSYPALGEPNQSPNDYASKGFVGSDTPAGAFVGYRNIKRRTQNHTGSGAGSAEFAATDPRRLDGPERDMGDATPGAEPQEDPPAQDVEFQQVDPVGNLKPAGDPNETRAVLKVPPSYLTGTFANKFGKYGGVLFPYTPQITLESKAEYSSQTPIHSNYAINFYKNSQVSDITVTATFTVQNDIDADYYVGALRLLTSLTKMRFGNEANAGSPPPVCRMFAYGEYILKNVPVVITSFRHDLPDDVDFYTTTSDFGAISVPTKATFTIGLKPTYSRAEMMNATVDAYLSNSLAGKGYL